MGCPSSVSTSLLYQPTTGQGQNWPLTWGFAGKPLSLGGPDTPENPQETVQLDRTSLQQALGYPSVTWTIPEQVHGHRVGRVGDAHLCQTDAVLVLQPHHPAMVLTADCVPIMLYDPVQHVGALVHAGWRGTAQNIVAETVLALENAVGIVSQNLHAVIGPAIGLCCFQISTPVFEGLVQAIGGEKATWAQENWVQWDEDMPHNPRVDLQALNAHQLKACGVTQIETVPLCTRCQNAAWHSFRCGDHGRNAAVMILGAAANRG